MLELLLTAALVAQPFTDPIIPVEPISDHGALGGLADDDHSQYLNETRHDADDHSGLLPLDHGTDIDGLNDDDHNGYLWLNGRAAGQVVYGGLIGGEKLTLQGTDDSTLGIIEVNSPIVFGPYQPSGQTYGFSYTATESFSAGFVGGGLNFSGNITFSNGVFIYESFRGAPTITTAVNPAFAAYTVLQALPRLVAGSGAGHNPLDTLVLNAGPQIANPHAGTRTTANVNAINWAGSLRAEAAGAVMNVTSWTGFINAPTYRTVGGSTINYGTIRGLWAKRPVACLFCGGAGTETMAGYYALDVDNIGNFGGTAPVAAVRSAISNTTGHWLLLNNGGANSWLGQDNTKLYLGTGQDAELYFNGSHLVIDPDPVTASAALYVGNTANNTVAAGRFQFGPTPSNNYFSESAGYLQAWFNTEFSWYVTGGTQIAAMKQDGGTGGAFLDLAPDSYIGSNTFKYLYFESAGTSYVEVVPGIELRGPGVIYDRDYDEVTSQTTTSATLEDISGNSFTLTIPTGHTGTIHAVLSVGCSASTANNTGAWAIEINSVDGTEIPRTMATANDDGAITVQNNVTGLTAGTYTVQGRHRRVSGAGNVETDVAQLSGTLTLE